MHNFSKKFQIKTSFEVPPYFVMLKEESKDYYEFYVFFSILQSDIVKNELSKIEISVLNQNNYRAYKEPQPKSSEDHINSLLQSHSSQIKRSLAKQKKVISKLTFDLSSVVPSSVMKSLKFEKRKPEDIQELFHDGEILTVVSTNSPRMKNNITAEKIRIMNLELLGKYKIDPSSIFYDDFSNRSSLAIKRGIVNYYTGTALYSLKKDGVYYGTLRGKKSFDRIYLNSTIKIEKSSVINSNILDVTFDIYQSDLEFPVSSERKEFDLISYIRFSKLAYRRPKLEFNNKILTATQIDEYSEGVSILRKSIDDSGRISKFSKVFERNILKGRPLNIPLKTDDSKIEIYRCTSLRNKATTPPFSSIVSGNQIFFDTTRLLINFSYDVASNSNSSYLPEKLNIIITNFPYDAAQFKIVRRQQLFDDVFGKEIIVSDFKTITNDSELIVDISAQNDKIYQYSIVYKMIDGTIRKSVTQVFHYLSALVSSAISTKISNLSTNSSNGSQSVQFNIDTTVVEKDFEKLKYALINANMYDEFRFELSKVKENFSSLITHKIVRLNLNSGFREEFSGAETGTLSETFIDNEQTQKKFSISPIDPLSTYCYEVYVSVRNPSTLLPENVMTETVKIGNTLKTYSYRPYKWRQPSSLKTGTILPEDNNGKTLLQKSMFDDGIIGMTAAILVNEKSQQHVISNFSAQRIDLNKIKLTWDMSTSILNFDHFVLIKEVRGQSKTILGSFYSDFIIDTVSAIDAGTVIYYIVPVLNDFSVGAAQRSNSIVINPDDFRYLRNL